MGDNSITINGEAVGSIDIDDDAVELRSTSPGKKVVRKTAKERNALYLKSGGDLNPGLEYGENKKTAEEAVEATDPGVMVDDLRHGRSNIDDEVAADTAEGIWEDSEGHTPDDDTFEELTEEDRSVVEKFKLKWFPRKRPKQRASLSSIEEGSVGSSPPNSPYEECIKYLKKKTVSYTMSSWWDYDGEFDPFQVFEVEHEACLHFIVTITKGEAITKGNSVKDFMDTPDPYVILRIPGCSNSSKRTSHVDNCTNPIWDETFHFYLDPAKEHNLKVTLMDANYTLDETLGEDTFCVNELTNDVTVDHVFAFPGGSKVHATLKLEKNKVPDLRFSLALCNEEKEFLLIRRKKVLVALQQLLGVDAPDTEKQVPIVGILGSGGGFRAMTCLSGAVKALHESGILDCATYIAGLSGSSWYISTYYAHDDFPHVTHTQIQDELRESVTTDWKWQLLKAGSYVTSMIAKYKRGQPVSFTDFFGHLLGDVLLKGKKHKKVTDMKKYSKQGIMPLPLFTCLHAKRNVSCKTFSEWVEFSPYEIGIAKYGTFMKTEDFGNKFIVGKKIKHFEELPLHFLQGVWGSAFTILFRRLVMEGGRKDIVQIMRDAQKENESDYRDTLNTEQASEEDSDSEEEEYIVGEDDPTEDDDSGEFPAASGGAKHRQEGGGHSGVNSFFPAVTSIPEGQEMPTRKRSDVEMPTRKLSEVPKSQSLDAGVLSLSNDGNKSHLRLGKSLDCLSLTDTEKEASENASSSSSSSSSKFNFSKKETNSRKYSTESDPGVQTEHQKTARSARLTRQGAVRSSRGLRKDSKDESKDIPQDGPENVWANRRKSLRKNRVEKKAGLWDGLKESIMTGTNILNSRAGRAGEVLNPFRGLSLRHSFPLSPFTGEGVEEEEDEVDLGKASRYEPLDNKAKKLFIVDSGLSFNSPYPLLLRPQRAIDIYLSFDFSQRPEDNHHPFKELLLAEKWALQNKVPFPPIEKQIEEYKKEEIRECYVFKHPSDNFCPVILHFPLVNKLFREYKKPGVPRTTDEEKSFADFPIFDDPNNPYSSMNFVYETHQFDRLTQLVEFNTLSCVDTIKSELVEIIKRKKQQVQKPFSLSDVVSTVKRLGSLRKPGSSSNLKLKLSEEKRQQLHHYIRQQSNSLARQASVESAESDYSDALEDQPDEQNDS